MKNAHEVSARKRLWIFRRFSEDDIKMDLKKVVSNCKLQKGRKIERILYPVHFSVKSVADSLPDVSAVEISGEQWIRGGLTDEANEKGTRERDAVRTSTLAASLWPASRCSRFTPQIKRKIPDPTESRTPMVQTATEWDEKLRNFAHAAWRKEGRLFELVVITGRTQRYFKLVCFGVNTGARKLRGFFLSYCVNTWPGCWNGFKAWMSQFVRGS